MTVVGQDDFLADNDQPFNIKITIDPGADYQYARLEPRIVAGINKDNDKAGFLVGEISGPTTEDGEAATFPVRLLTEPLAPVTLYLVSDTQKEGRITNSELVFTSKNWNQDQIVTVVGQNDFIADEDASYHIMSKQIISQDSGYNNLAFPKVSVINKRAVDTVGNIKLSSGLQTTPNLSGNTLGLKTPTIQKPETPTRLVREIKSQTEKADVTVSMIEEHTSESGKSARFSVCLSVKPTVDIIVYLESKNKNEGKVEPDHLTFTPQNWDRKQMATVVGQDDKIADGNQIYDVEIRPTSDGDYRYSRLAPIIRQVVNNDNDLAGFEVKKISATTTENGKTASFAISLKSEPTAPVIIPLSSDDLNEGVLTISTLEFNQTNWDQEQRVTVTGQDDKLADGRKSYNIVLGKPISQDTRYHDLTPPSIQFFNEDNDSAGLTHSEIKDNTREDGQVTTFMVRLNTQPVDTVLVSLSSSNTGEGLPDPKQITFTSKNWREAQKVRIVGQDDAVNDGDQKYYIQLSTHESSDKVYKSLAPLKVGVINEDDDIAGIYVGKPVGETSEKGEQVVFALRLTSQPITDVKLSVESLNPSEGDALNKSVVFDGNTWNKEQFISVAGVDDFLADGNQPFKVQISVEKSEDPRYQLLDPVFLDLINRDDDKAGFVIGTISGNTSEDGDQATFTMALTSKPTADVSVELVSNDDTEGVLTTSGLIFTPANWNIKQVVTVTGVNDQLVDGAQRFVIVTSPASSLDPKYNTLNADDIFVVNLDNNLTTFYVSDVKGKTMESGRSETIVVRLKSQPKSTVTINIACSDLSEGVAQPTHLTFNSRNWDQDQKVLVSGIDDSIHDGDQPYQLVFTASSEEEPAYNNIPPVIRHLRNLDDDQAGISVRVINEISNEEGEIAEFAVRLNSEPISAVVLLFSSSNPQESNLLTKQASFNGKNWKEEQIIRIQGVADNRVDDNQDYKIISAGGISNDPSYNKMPFPEVKLVNRNMNTARFIVSPISGNTSEIGSTANFTVRLNSKPDYKVTIALKSSNLNEGRI
ncbi:hypothetical protein KKA14_16910, partial [bacterium]|nr:hypothetical protein [bacterium]